MSPLTVAWSMFAATSFVLGGLHVILWLKDRQRWIYLLSVLMAFAAGATALTDLGLMYADSPETFRTLLKLQGLTIFLILVPMVWFVYGHFGTARLWLAWTITSLWGVSLVINILSPHSLVFAELVALESATTFWGEQFVTGVGSANPWVIVPHAASFLIVIYVLDASVRAWRRGFRQRAILTGGGIILFTVLAGVHTPLVDAGIVATPYMVSFWFLAIVVALSYELVSNAVQVSRYARKIQASEKRWRTLMENVQLPVIGIDGDRRISYVNPFLEKLSGYRRDELIGRSVGSLGGESDSVEVVRALAQVENIGARHQSRWSLVCASGEKRDLLWCTVELQNSDGSHAGLLSVGEDITDRLQATRDLQHTQRELEHMTRTNILGELASGLAHELNQPLAAILSNAQAARRGLASGSTNRVEQLEILEDIIRDDKRAAEVIQRLRALLHRGEIKREIVNVKEVVHEVNQLLHAELVARHVTLNVDLPDDLPDVEAGRVEIQQVLMNLMLNAIRALARVPKENRQIGIHAILVDGELQIAIDDSGPGVESDNLGRLFEAFYTTENGGLGMGLSICRRIIEAHAGRIWADNVVGGGARFSFTLPTSERHSLNRHG